MLSNGNQSLANAGSSKIGKNDKVHKCMRRTGMRYGYSCASSGGKNRDLAKQLQCSSFSAATSVQQGPVMNRL